MHVPEVGTAAPGCCAPAVGSRGPAKMSGNVALQESETPPTDFARSGPCRMPKMLHFLELTKGGSLRWRHPGSPDASGKMLRENGPPRRGRGRNTPHSNDLQHKARCKKCCAGTVSSTQCLVGWGLPPEGTIATRLRRLRHASAAERHDPRQKVGAGCERTNVAVAREGRSAAGSWTQDMLWQWLTAQSTLRKMLRWHGVLDPIHCRALTSARWHDWHNVARAVGRPSGARHHQAGRQDRSLAVSDLERGPFSAVRNRTCRGSGTRWGHRNTSCPGLGGGTRRNGKAGRRPKNVARKRRAAAALLEPVVELPLQGAERAGKRYAKTPDRGVLETRHSLAMDYRTRHDAQNVAHPMEPSPASRVASCAGHLAGGSLPVSGLHDCGYTPHCCFGYPGVARKVVLFPILAT
jgi:hypothetical protein